MYFKIALALLTAWLLEVVGVYQAHTLSRVCLLVGIMFLLLALAKARDAAARRGKDVPFDKR